MWEYFGLWTLKLSENLLFLYHFRGSKNYLERTQLIQNLPRRETIVSKSLMSNLKWGLYQTVCQKAIKTSKLEKRMLRSVDYFFIQKVRTWAYIKKYNLITDFRGRRAEGVWYKCQFKITFKKEFYYMCDCGP